VDDVGRYKTRYKLISSHNFPMTNVADYVLSLPALLLILFAIGCLVMGRMYPPEWRWLNGATAIAGILFSIAGLAKLQLTQAQLALSGIRLQVGFQHSMVVDELAIYFYYLILVGTLLAVLIGLRRPSAAQALTMGEVSTGALPGGGFYAVMLCGLVGLMAMASGFHLGFIFAGVVVSEAAGCTMVRVLAKEDPARSAWRRFVAWRVLSVAILGTGFLVLRAGAGAAGLHEIRQAAARLAGGDFPAHREFRIGLALTAIGIILRLAALPFHQWNHTARDGQPANVGAQNCVTGVFSAVYPAAAWAMGLHVFLWGMYPLRDTYAPWLIWAAVALLGAGTLAILMQADLRRLVAYSALPAAGYMLAAMAAVAQGDPFSTALTSGLRAILVYLPAMILMNMGALAGIAILRQEGLGGEIGDLRGLSFRAPLQAELLLIAFLSIIGMPPLAGFYGKYYAYMSVSGAGHRKVAFFGMACAILGVWCVVRMARKLFTRVAYEQPRPAMEISGPWVVLILGVGGIIVTGVHPQFLIQLANWAAHLR
jgi:NADH-quinone oxidoreductase subunit N